MPPRTRRDECAEWNKAVMQSTETPVLPSERQPVTEEWAIQEPGSLFPPEFCLLRTGWTGLVLNALKHLRVCCFAIRIQARDVRKQVGRFDNRCGKNFLP